MVAETWILKMGNQVSSNLKNALHLDNSSKSLNKKQAPQERAIIGILSFEVANVMSKIINLHKSLTDQEVLKFKNEILTSEGIKTLVSSDETQLLELALLEKLDDLNRIAGVVSRLGKKCTIPALQGFEHVYGDIISGVIDVQELSFLVKDMEGMMRKMERYVNSTVSLYSEMEVMNELESATKKFQQNHLEESRQAFEQKLMRQRQDVKHLKDISLWNQTFDKVVELLARSTCTVYARIHIVFGDSLSKGNSSIPISTSQVGFGGSMRCLKQETVQKSSHSVVASKALMEVSSRKSPSSTRNGYSHSRAVSFRPKAGLHKSEGGLFGPEDFNFVCGIRPGRLFMECLSLRSSASKVDDDDHVSYDDQSSQISGAFSVAHSTKSDNGASLLGSLFRVNEEHRQFNCSLRNTKKRLLMEAPPNTIGCSALTLHYANVIIIIEKLLCYPHLVGDEVRDDLYQMLPRSLRRSLKSRLQWFSKNMGIYDASVAHDWMERAGETLQWLGPLAHNTIKWQSERNFEQHQQIVSRSNVLLLQTLYYCDRVKAEEAMSEVLVGLNYICRYEQQQNALLDSFDFEECMEWQMQSPAFHTF